MSGSSFRRARGYLKRRWGKAILGHTCGLAASLLYLALIFLLVLYVDFLLSKSGAPMTGEAAEFAARLTGQSAAQVASQVDHGMLPTVVHARGTWYGPLLRWIYERMPWTHRDFPYLAGLAAIAVAIGLVRAALLLVQSVATASVSALALADLQRDLFRHQFSSGEAAFELEGHDRVAGLLREQLPLLHEGLHASLDTYVREPAKIVLLLAFAFLLNPLLVVCFLIMAALIWILASGELRRVLRRRKEREAEAEGELKRLLGLASKLRLIRGYAADDYFNHRYETHLGRHHHATIRRLRYEGRLPPLWQLYGFLLMVGVLTLGAQNILIDRFSVPGAAGISAALLSLVLPVIKLIQARQAIRRAEPAAEAVFDFLDLPPSRVHRDGDRFLEPLSRSIDLERVTVLDERERVLLDDLSIRIHAGQRIGIMGRSDAEKRALVYLLTRFIQPAHGHVRIDGQDLREVTAESLRSQVCAVLQSDLLFPDTIANNIGCGDPGYTLPRIIEAAKTAHAHQFIQKLPHGYECQVGEGGFPLKTGEAFRIALARAILRDPPIVIVEEPREPLDEETKALVDDTMNRFFAGRTVLVLPGRLSSLRACDEIFLLDKGKLVGCGSHRELVETSELYRHLEYTEFHRRPAFAS